MAPIYHGSECVVLIHGLAPCNSRVLCLEDYEQDVQVDSKAQEKEEEEELKEEQQEQREEEEEVDEQDVMKVLGNLLMSPFIKYWIYICSRMFFFISFEGKIMMYNIIYMVLVLFYMALYQLVACVHHLASSHLSKGMPELPLARHCVTVTSLTHRVKGLMRFKQYRLGIIK